MVTEYCMAERIKDLRGERGWRQGDLAAALGVSRALVSLWEIGQARPRATEIEAMADLFSVSTDYLLGRTDLRAPAAAIAAGNPALPPILRRMFAQHRLRTPAQVALFAECALTDAEIGRLLAGESPSTFAEERLARFFRKFNLELIRDYYRAAQAPMPQEYRDIAAEIRELADRVYLSTDGSPEALEYVIRAFREEFEGKRKERGHGA